MTADEIEQAAAWLAAVRELKRLVLSPPAPAGVGGLDLYEQWDDDCGWVGHAWAAPLPEDLVRLMAMEGLRIAVERLRAMGVQGPLSGHTDDG